MNEFLDELINHPKLEEDIVWAFLDAMFYLGVSEYAEQYTEILDTLGIEYEESNDFYWALVFDLRAPTINRKIPLTVHLNKSHFYRDDEAPHSCGSLLFKSMDEVYDILNDINAKFSDIKLAPAQLKRRIYWNGLPFCSH